MATREQVAQAFEKSIATMQEVLKSDGIDILASMAERIASSLKKGGKLLLCGNGGSAADAQHLAAELLIRLRPHVDRMPLPAIALTMDMSTITACGNDYSFDDIFARPLQALGRPQDVLLVITTSGRSTNIKKALEAAHRIGIATMGFLGGTGGVAASLCDLAFIVPSMETARIQESHITAGHVVMEMVEDAMIENHS